MEALNSSFSSLWGSMNFDESDVQNFLNVPPTGDEIDALLTDNHEFDSLDLDDDDEEDIESSNLPGVINDVSEETHIARVSPEPPESPRRQCPERSSSESSELQRQYQATLEKLAKSMRRSDETRSIVKRQRLHSPDLKIAGAQTDFFNSERCRELEESRVKLVRMMLPK